MAKNNDPAFLFYSQDFYAGTRTMLPNERAAYVDLLIYQHQNGVIPLDTNRVLMFCSGIEKATLEATLEAKFKQTSNGWINEKLQKVVEDRQSYKSNQSKNGVIGQFWKKANSALKAKEQRVLREYFSDMEREEMIELFSDFNKKSKASLKASLKATLKHLENENENENESKIETEKKKKEPELIFPFDDKDFLKWWDEWIAYKKRVHKFTYQDNSTKQTLLMRISEYFATPEEAVDRIKSSISNKWHGLIFENDIKVKDMTKSDRLSRRKNRRALGQSDYNDRQELFKEMEMKS